MNELKILIAEDTKEARDILKENLIEFHESSDLKNISLKIEACESFAKALAKLKESEKSGTFYHVFFADVDFTEDKKGGKRNSGYELIKTAFGICPLTKICTYSGQFRAADLWSESEQLIKEGLIVFTMDKSHSAGGGENWWFENFKKIYEELRGENILWELWYNHRAITEKIQATKFLSDTFENMSLCSGITANLETILVLIRQLKKLDEKAIFYRLLIHLYHQALETFCRAGKSEIQIAKESAVNKELVEDEISW